ncbi:5786_t:CDS:2 [Ambispora gerdemannii]|uniref:5786_t:CDS:1 n=1 Tax=Ambispora gerdemannii TaxID=144530 RepID=A0A9N9ATL6_9GLOM|nr:5786_t:CDS:2 [Ambispora gerdemannii]
MLRHAFRRLPYSRPKTINRFFSTTKARHATTEYDALVLGAYKDGSFAETATKEIPLTTQEAIRQRLKLSNAKGKIGEVRVFYGVEGEASSVPKQIAVVGLGKKSSEKGEVDLSEALEKARHAACAAEGASLGLYRYDSLRSKKNKKSEVKFGRYGDSPSSESSELTWETGLIYADAQNFARYLAETPSNLMTPSIFAENVISKLDGLKNIEIHVRDQGWAINNNMGAFLAVDKGSTEPLRFLEIHYKGGKEGEKPLALVGKGITFDSGGISIKPSQNMGDMKGDMAGGAAVASSLYGLAKLQAPINIVASIPLCENMPSGHATKPGDVVKAMNGKSIEIDNTDAEGRLILADAIYYTSSTYKPHSLIDFATLTGAIGISLGEVYAGVFTNSESLWTQLSSAGKTTHDPFWRMPLHPAYKKSITKSTVADIINNSGRMGSSCSAAGFLEEFVDGLLDDEKENDDDNDNEGVDEAKEAKNPDKGDDIEKVAETNVAQDKIQFAHVDIAGVMDTNDDSGYTTKGMTGRPTRSIIEFARKISDSK